MALVVLASSLFACSCSHCSRCAQILPIIKKNFKSVGKKYKDEDKNKMVKAYNKVVDIDKVAHLLEMRNARNFKELTLMQFDLISLEKEKEFLYQNGNELRSIERNLEIMDGEMSQFTSLYSLYSVQTKR